MRKFLFCLLFLAGSVFTQSTAFAQVDPQEVLPDLTIICALGEFCDMDEREDPDLIDAIERKVDEFCERYPDNPGCLAERPVRVWVGGKDAWLPRVGAYRINLDPQNPWSHTWGNMFYAPCVYFQVCDTTVNSPNLPPPGGY